MDSRIKLTIRAPNQRVDDQTVECMLGWTVKKLKQHLQIVYPNKPREAQQKLIYSGKLLSDEQTLKDIIRQGDDTLQHTVHLVCLPSFELPSESHRKVGLLSTPKLYKGYSITASRSVRKITVQEGKISVHVRDRQTSPVMSSSSVSSTSQTAEGLRHRGRTLPSSQADFVTTTVPTQSAVQTPPVMMPPGPDMALTPEQYMMMMQTYYYQMAAQYMQYYQTGVNVTPPATPAAEEQVQPPHNNAPNPAAPPNNNPVMNAQGGMVDDDDDDELGPRDWLDYVYTFSRFLVLVSIVYFYSNFTRFFAVCAFFFLVHLYQGGFFNLRRRQPQAQQQQDEGLIQENQHPNQQPQQQIQQHQQQNDIPNNQQQQNNHQNGNSQDKDDSNQEDTETAAIEEQAPPQPGVLAVTWCFISTFFTSLIPAPPPPVNAN
ncbi:hypothetical protein FSP39_000958 [Pinctada imbricata]|uniref:Ubiquitin-like domain-containing protein n=1 Tax=Pinctada imbricata TaxID=66713 RepID=A0AA88XM00_PINIB|nr:hypothetical protein FSP39_000958 [Pinctada imbricata]